MFMHRNEKEKSFNNQEKWMDNLNDTIPYLMSYAEAGTGIPILFIHGYPLSNKLWEPQFLELADNFRLVIPDLRGHGFSVNAPGPFSMEQMADDCAFLLDHMNIKEKIILCGLSMGGYVTFTFYRKFQDRIAGMILTATRAAADTDQVRKNRESVIETVSNGEIGLVLDAMLPKLLSPENYRNNHSVLTKVKAIMQSAVTKDTIVNDQIALLNRKSSLPLLSKIKKSVLIIHGIDDQIVPIQEAQAMHASIPGSQLVLLPQAGHLPNLEQPNLFNSTVRKFIYKIRSEYRYE